MGGRYAGVLAFHGDSVALVRESYPGWGGRFWSVPSGAVEHDESPAQGAARELREETGLLVLPRDLELVSTSVTTSGTGRSDAWNYTARVPTSALQVDDPDGLIEDVRWFARALAIEALQQLPYEPLKVPALSYLRGDHASFTEWSFRI